MSLILENSLQLNQLQAEVAALKSALSETQTKLSHTQTELNWYKEQYQLTRSKRFGKKSESSHSLQLTLFDENESDEVTETVESIDEEREQVTYERKKPKRKNSRNIDTSALPREQRIHDLSESEKMCACGCQMQRFGEDKSEQIDYVPAKLVVIEHITPKYACKDCEQIKSGKKSEHPIPKCMATVNFITDVIVKKYEHHLPLYRQSQILKQDGIDIPDNTLGNWVMGAANALETLGDAAWQELNNIQQLQADETPVKILKPDKKGYMWAYHSLAADNRFVLFEFSLSRSSEVVNHRLQHYRGLLQTDGYSGYNTLRERNDVTTLGCWDHARRKFSDAIKAGNNNLTGLGGQILTKINALYKVERAIKSASESERLNARRERSRPLLDDIYQLASKANVPPKSTLGRAIGYLLNHFKALGEYISHPDMPISNILIENQIRPFALGRKNWLFMGNEKSANRSALLYSLIQSCKINHINPRHYLIAILSRASQMRRGDIEPRTLLPQFIDHSLL